MIQLTRTRTAAAVPASLRGEKRRKKEKELLSLWQAHLTAGGAGSPKWKDGYWKAGKTQLKKETRGKCAYCESETAVVAHGDVEHFRPKAAYWWLAYCFDNHLYACQICNQSFKGDQFPLAPGSAPMGGPAVTPATTPAQLAALVDTFAPDAVDVTNGYAQAAFEAACLAEQAGLPCPYQVDPEPFFRWEADAVNKEVWLRARSTSAAHRFVLESCEAALGLNREELRRCRWTMVYERLELNRDILAELDAKGVVGKARDLVVNGLRRMRDADQPYAAMARYFINVKWALPV